MVISMGPVWYYQRHNIHGDGFFLPLAFFDLKEEIGYVRASDLIHALLITDFLYNLNKSVVTYFMAMQTGSPQISILPL